MTTTLGLDVGGAHLKAAWLSCGELIDVAQEPDGARRGRVAWARD